MARYIPVSTLDWYGKAKLGLVYAVRIFHRADRPQSVSQVWLITPTPPIIHEFARNTRSTALVILRGTIMVSGKVIAGGFLLERSGDRSAISFGWHMVAPNDGYQDMAPVFFNQILSPKAKVPGSSMFPSGSFGQFAHPSWITTWRTSRTGISQQAYCHRPSSTCCEHRSSRFMRSISSLCEK